MSGKEVEKKIGKRDGKKFGRKNGKRIGKNGGRKNGKKAGKSIDFFLQSCIIKAHPFFRSKKF